MDIYVDVDETLMRTEGMDYESAQPIPENIDKINKIFDAGHTITVWTARGAKSGIDWRDLTEKQLDEAELKYHYLRLDKPPFDVFIDDKALNARSWEKGEWI
ncbi:MAG: hypothetical protein P8J32_06120 [bacterium]|nr:hypothetical protein [bacterium]